MTPAVIWVPADAGHIITYADQCLTDAAAKGYTFDGLVTTSWRHAFHRIVDIDGVMLVARPEHLDPRRLPRVEVVAPPDEPRHPRTQLIRRP